MDSIEKQALRIEETLRKLGFKDILIERIRDEKCEWKPNREISISLEPKSPSLPRSAEIFKENSVWHLSFGSFGFHASDELFTLFLENIVNHLSEDKSISQEIIDGLEDEVETSNLETLDCFLDSTRDVFGTLGIVENRVRIVDDNYICVFGHSQKEYKKYLMVLDLKNADSDNLELTAILESRVLFCKLTRHLREKVDRGKLFEALNDVNNVFSIYEDICQQLQDQSNYSLKLVDSSSAEPVSRRCLGDYRELMAVYGNAVIPFQAGVIPSCAEYESEERGVYIEFASKVKSLTEMLDEFPEGEWCVDITQDCSC